MKSINNCLLMVSVLFLAIFPLTAAATEIVCTQSYLSCETGKCGHFTPQWLLKLKGDNRQKVNFIFNDTGTEVYMNGRKLDTDYTNYKGRYTIQVLADNIYIDFYRPNSCPELSLKCAGPLATKIRIDRESGFYLQEDLHTDGSIEGLALGAPYSQLYGYCSNKPNREF